MYSVEEAAKGLGISDRRVRVLLNEGRIGGENLSYDWIVIGLDYKRKRKVKRNK